MTGTASLRKILLVPATLPAIRDACTKNPDRVSLPWLYLSSDALLRRQISGSVSEEIRFVEIGDRLQAAAHASRQEYIDYVGNLSATYNSPAWWLTSISEKNPFISPLFLYICYLSVLDEELAGVGDIVVVCDSEPLIAAIQDSFCSREGIAISVHGNGSSGTASRAGSRLRGLLGRALFAARFLLRIPIAKLFRVLRPGNFSGGPGGIFIHSWTDSRSFARPSGYTDAYFGQLAGTIQEECPETVIISNILPMLWYPKAVLSLLKCSDRIQLFENYLSFSDIFRALALVRTQVPEIAKAPPFRQFVLTAIIQDALRADRTESTRPVLCALHRFAGQRLAQATGARAVFATFENHMWEKMFWTGIRETGTGCRCIGYAHSIVSPWYLFYSLAAAERAIAPVPDYILVNGPVARDRLGAAGFDPATIRVCGAFRYGKTEKSRAEPGTPGGEKRILVIPTVGINETIEMVDTVVLAFRDMADVTILIKLHPNLPESRILPLYRNIPSHIRFVSEPAGELLASTDLVLVTESAVAIEALARQIPVLHIRSGLRVDMNIFDGISRIPSESAPGRIARKAKELLADSGMDEEEFRDLVQLFFAPVDEQVVTDLICPPTG